MPLDAAPLPVALLYSKGVAPGPSSDYPCRVHHVRDLAEAIAYARDREPAVVIAEAMPGDPGAVDLLRRVYLDTDSVRILATPFPAPGELLLQALNLCHAYAIVRTPWLPLELATCLQQAVAEHELSRLAVPIAADGDGLRGRPAQVCHAVEDDPDYRLLIEEAWAMSSPFSIHLSPDAPHLVSALRGQPPDVVGLVLMDLNLPRVDGFECLQEIRRDPVLRSMPVVIYTNSNDDVEIRRAHDLGANGYVVKPRTFSDLVQQMTCLSRYWLEHNCHPPHGAAPVVLRVA